MAHDHGSHSHGHSHGDDHGHGQGHNHAHAGGHGHSHAPTDFGARFLWAAALNTAFIIAEVIFGLKANSLALLADAGHNFSDAISLVLSWAAWWLAKRKPGGNFTYGYRGASIMAALFNALLLMVAVGGIVWEAVQRFNSVQPVQGDLVMWVAGAGILVNGFTAWLFAQGQSDLNIKAAFAHLAADAVVSAAVVVAGLAMIFTGWAWLDPALSIVVSLVIVWGTWGLLRDSVRLSLQGVPPHIDAAKVKAFLAGLEGVSGVHDLHIWGMSTTEVALTVHLIMPAGHPGDDFLRHLAEELSHHHGIIHATVQIETGAHACVLESEEMV
ncbi:cation diffusion facilitator family transporter [Asticcacaulis sp. 201]|uniref:cation diffusion facilitator family transporter n=1 Tax=Asticcacaulis sp. 201 TaxID=3028787 RepID=UPI002915DE75|nr:cation diffusion facilitator family transporter [Asticcacaulis sp. 201]MDV6331883.1 cation diffusion facilitator family transporter [Asticcacaulis sp. 201]